MRHGILEMVKNAHVMQQVTLRQPRPIVRYLQIARKDRRSLPVKRSPDHCLDNVFEPRVHCRDILTLSSKRDRMHSLETPDLQYRIVQQPEPVMHDADTSVAQLLGRAALSWPRTPSDPPPAH